MAELRSESDYGTELDWDDESLEATLVAIEQRASFNRVNATATTALQHVPIEVEAQEESVGVAQSAGGAEEAEAAEDPDGGEMTALRPSRLWELYRQRRGWGALSVSDLSGPSWCEVQHTYRLASKPFLPPLERPATITTSAGATIEIDTKRTVRREGILDRGKEIHRKIEKQVMGDVEEVKVNVSGKEEWWALRILNTIVCLETLLSTGKVRELPVVGWLGSHLVFGVIDEVERRELEPDTKTSKPATSSSRPVKASPRRKKSSANAKKAETPEKDDQSKLDRFFSILRSPAKSAEQSGDPMVVDLTGAESPDMPSSVTPSAGATSPTAPTADVEARPPRWGFVVSDTKTRYNRSIPAPSESRPARLQLMLYHCLLSALLAPDTSEAPPPGVTTFSWSRLYAHLSLVPDESLSEEFLASIEPVLSSSDLLSGGDRPKTLGDYVDALQRCSALIRGDRPTSPLLDELEIVYRVRWDNDKTFPGRRGKKRVASVTATPATSQPADAKMRRLSEDGTASPANDAQEDTDLERAIALSLMDVEDRDSSGAANTTEAHVEDPSDADAESQPEDSQLPFYANPSLPVVVPSSPERQRTTSMAEGEVPDPLGTAFTLPRNSQADALDPPDVDLPSPIVPPRYNLRKRSSIKATTSVPPVRATTSAVPAPVPATSSADTPRQPSAPKSPNAAGDKDLIGIDRFKNNLQELDQYLGRILAYWNGERAPEGVALAQTHRCRSCEFEEGCEWRALKAAEVLTEARERRLAREKRQ